MIQVKDLSVLDGLLRHPVHEVLIDLILWFSVRFSETVFTCGFEQRDYPSVHSVVPLRGVDVRSQCFEHPDQVADEINAHWLYDPDRPRMACATYHDTGRGPHIHLQACDRTARRDPDEAVDPRQPV